MAEIINTIWEKEIHEKYKQSEFRNTQWFRNLTEEQQKELSERYEERYDLEKLLETKKTELKLKWISVNIIDNFWSQIENLKDNKLYEETLDILNRDIDMLNRELYSINLKLNEPHLEKAYKKRLEEEKQDDILKNFIEKIDMNNLTAWEVYILKQKWYDLSRLFLEYKDSRDKTSKDNMKIWDKFIVNFWWNKLLNQNIWAWDLLAIDKISKVKINWILWERRYEPRPWYYLSNGKYLAIFDNYEVEIVLGEELWEKDLEKYNNSIKERCRDVRWKELIVDFQKSIKDLTLKSIKYEWKFKQDFFMLLSFIKKNQTSFYENLEFDENNFEINIKNWKTFWDIKFPKYLWEWFYKYKEMLVDVCADYTFISEMDLAILINHENPSWDPYTSAPWSSAYWLWQMIDSTWNKYWYWLERSNPRDQLEATCRYLKNIIENKKCSIKLAMAYYNTWERIMNISKSKAVEYARKNPAITRKILQWGKIKDIKEMTPEFYFTWAVAYYNDINYKEAERLV